MSDEIPKPDHSVYRLRRQEMHAREARWALTALGILVPNPKDPANIGEPVLRLLAGLFHAMRLRLVMPLDIATVANNAAQIVAFESSAESIAPPDVREPES